jgi:hypothetical protein
VGVECDVFAFPMAEGLLVSCVWLEGCVLGAFFQH